ncbi:MAG: hypothetical protein H6736_14125 [Alphaproteobacteria bacterium]|nr:hypothetical protein [Alphaproteobacteria bacterium]MCB9692944.1 hypothetical protein [Alphaproteobacteria bacterium]
MGTDASRATLRQLALYLQAGAWPLDDVACDSGAVGVLTLESMELEDRLTTSSVMVPKRQLTLGASGMLATRDAPDALARVHRRTFETLPS